MLIATMTKPSTRDRGGQRAVGRDLVPLGDVGDLGADLVAERRQPVLEQASWCGRRTPGRGESVLTQYALAPGGLAEQRPRRRQRDVQRGAVLLLVVGDADDVEARAAPAAVSSVTRSPTSMPAIWAMLRSITATWLARLLLGGGEPAAVGERGSGRAARAATPQTNASWPASSTAFFEHRLCLGHARGRADRVLGALVEERRARRSRSAGPRGGRPTTCAWPRSRPPPGRARRAGCRPRARRSSAVARLRRLRRPMLRSPICIVRGRNAARRSSRSAASWPPTRRAARLERLAQVDAQTPPDRRQRGERRRERDRRAALTTSTVRSTPKPTSTAQNVEPK